MRCQRCNKENGEKYRRNTAYTDDKNNFAICCKECQELDNEEMQERWDEYNRGRF